MAIKFYGEYLRKLREHAGLSQEKLADGIINLQSLNRIENNRAGVSPGIFQALTSKCGAPTEVFPLFANWDDFDCFYELYKADMWLGSWQTKDAAQCLKIVEKKIFAGNKIYYQKWLYYHALLQLRSGGDNYEEIQKILMFALEITKVDIDFDEIKSMLLTVVEIEILTAIAEMFFMLGNSNECLTICSQLRTYLDNASLSYIEKSSLILGVKKVYTLYLIQNKEYEKALEEAKELRENSLLQMAEKHILDGAFFYGVIKYITGEEKEGIHLIKSAYYSGKAIESNFAIASNNILKVLKIVISDLKSFSDKYDLQEGFLLPDIDTNLSLNEGECDYYSDKVITLGKIIRQKRKEQRISMEKLCQGLCSVSSLSKIENDTLQPGIFLSIALLQRLGISDEPFTFYASERESKQYRLEKELSGISRYSSQNIKDFLAEMKKEVMPQNHIFEQLYNNYSIFYSDSIQEKSIALYDNLKMTLPDFSIDNIANYRLSKNELAYVISYCMTIRKEKSITKATKDLYKVFDYINQKYIDDLFKNSVIGVITATLVGVLGVQKRYAEIIDLLTIFNDKILYGHTHCLPTIFANVTFAYIEENKSNLVDQYLKYAYYLFELHENPAGRAFLERTQTKTGREYDIEKTFAS